MGTHIHQGTGRPRAVQPALTEPKYKNIGTPHSACSRRETFGGTYVGRIGDIRRCEHGKVQMLIEPERGMKGPGTWFWATLHPFWDFKLYRKVVKALG